MQVTVKYLSAMQLKMQPANGNISEYNPVMHVNAKVGSRFSSNVSISGNYAFVVALYDFTSVSNLYFALSFYHFDGTNWQLMSKKSALPPVANDNFGSSIHMSGKYAFVGLPGDDIGNNAGEGSVMLYQDLANTATAAIYI